MPRGGADPNLYARNSLQDSYNPAGGAIVSQPFFQEALNPNMFMIYPQDYPRGDEVLEWLDERGLGHLPTMYLGFVEIAFPDSDDAMLFKLVFG
jgi:hypothetical protein